MMKIYDEDVAKIATNFEGSIKWKIWKRKEGTNRVNFFITYGDWREIQTLCGKTLTLSVLKESVKEYVKKNNLFRKDYDAA